MTTTQHSLSVRTLFGVTAFCRDADLSDDMPESWRDLEGDVMIEGVSPDLLSNLGVLSETSKTGRTLSHGNAIELDDDTFVRQVPGYTYMIVRHGELIFLDGTRASGRAHTYDSDYLVLGHLEMADKS